MFPGIGQVWLDAYFLIPHKPIFIEPNRKPKNSIENLKKDKFKDPHCTQNIGFKDCEIVSLVCRRGRYANK